MASGLAERRLPKPPEAMPGLKARSALGHCAGRMPPVAERRASASPRRSPTPTSSASCPGRKGSPRAAGS